MIIWAIHLDDGCLNIFTSFVSGDSYKDDKERKDEGRKVTLTINCCDKKYKKPDYDTDKRLSKDNDSYELNVI